MRRLFPLLSVLIGIVPIACAGWSCELRNHRESDALAVRGDFKFKGMSATSTGSGLSIAAFGDNPCFQVKVAEPRSNDCLRIRVDENRDGRWLHLRNGGTVLLPVAVVRAGLWTIPFAEFQTASAGDPTLTGYMGGLPTWAGIEFSEFSLVDRDAAVGVSMSARRADGTAVAYGETVSSGDALMVEMPLPDKPDHLGLSFYRVVCGKAWNQQGLLKAFELHGAPETLTAAPRRPNVYRAVFRVPKLPAAETLKRGELIAAVHFLGGDSHDNGLYYGVSPFAFSFAEDPFLAKPSDDFRIYDFGPADGTTPPGATAVTPTDTPKGLRWIVRPTEFAASGIRQLDALASDWAAAYDGKEMSFALALPKGRYVAVAGFGAIGRNCFTNNRYLPTGAEVDVDGKPVFVRRPDVRKTEWYRWLGHEARADEDVYATYLQPLLIDARFEIESVGSENVFRFRAPTNTSAVCLQSLCLWPADDGRGERRFAELLRARRRHFEEFWKFEPQRKSDVASPDAVKRGDLPREPLVLVARENPQSFVYSESLPLVSELGSPLRGAAAPGECYDHSVMVCARADLKGVKLEVEGLPPSVRTRCLKVMLTRKAHNFTATMRIGPNHLLPDSRDMRKDTSAGWYVQFDVAPDCKPGVYRGEIVATWEGPAPSGPQRTRQSASLPVEFEVYPVVLPKLADHRIAENGGGDGTPPHLRAGRNLLGCNSFTPMLSFTENRIDFTRGADGRINGVTRLGGLTLPELSDRFKLAKEMGYDFPAPYVSLMPMAHRAPFKMGKIEPHTPDYVDAIRAAYSTLVAVARSNGYETVTLDLGGEMGYGDNYPPEKTLDEAVWLYKTIKAEVPEMLLSYRCNCKATVERFYPVLDVMGVRGSKSWDAADKLSDFGRNKPVYTYSVGGRYQNGLLSWYHGAKGNYREWLGICHHLEFNDFVCQGVCGGSVHCELVMGPDGEWLPTVRGEAWRASIDDRRYLRLLEEAMGGTRSVASAASAADGTEAVPPICRHAADFLAALRANVVATMRDERHCWYNGAYREDGNGLHVSVRMDLVREICVKLTRALKGESADDLPPFVPETRDRLEFHLWDGPFNRAGRPQIVGSFETRAGTPEAQAAAEVRVKRNGQTVQTVPVDIPRTEWAPSASMPPRRVFLVDGARLGSGTYELELVLGGQVRAMTPLTLL